MDYDTKSKNILDQMLNAVTNRDEKAALEAAKKHIADLEAALAKTQADLRSAEAKIRVYELEKLHTQQQAAVVQAAQAQILATHTLTADETLSHLSLKYYGHATKKYWKIIYDANKDVIGPNPNAVRPGLVIKIPVLPETLK